MAAGNVARRVARDVNIADSTHFLGCRVMQTYSGDGRVPRFRRFVQLRISAIVDARFGLIADAVST